jgi:hypothetical protein
MDPFLQFTLTMLGGAGIALVVFWLSMRSDRR